MQQLASMIWESLQNPNSLIWLSDPVNLTAHLSIKEENLFHGLKTINSSLYEESSLREKLYPIDIYLSTSRVFASEALQLQKMEVLE